MNAEMVFSTLVIGVLGGYCSAEISRAIGIDYQVPNGCSIWFHKRESRPAIGASLSNSYHVCCEYVDWCRTGTRIVFRERERATFSNWPPVPRGVV
jgi:hypothetical protein